MPLPLFETNTLIVGPKSHYTIPTGAENAIFSTVSYKAMLKLIFDAHKQT